MNKEHNFISAVVYVDNDSDETVKFFDTLNNLFKQLFLLYEIIVVNSQGSSYKGEKLKKWASDALEKPLTFVHLSSGQTHEQCMNAGLDIAIGDYVYEFDMAYMNYPYELIYQSYETSIQGNDIVTVCPKHEKPVSRLFYFLFNSHSGLNYKLRTDVFRLISRRALNRAHAMNENLIYRKAAYAACGLKSVELEFESVQEQSTKSGNPVELAVNSLILYTSFGYKFSLLFSLIMLFGTIAMGIYTVIIYAIGNPVNGWTTTMLALLAGLTGIFAILTMMLKYLDLIVKLIFEKQKYLVENIEKI